jgi:hypothetical protein
VNEPVPAPLTPAELEAELGTALPAKEVMSLLDLNIDIDLALALAAPIDLAIAGNLNIAAPINGAVSANVVSLFSNAAAQGTQGVMIDQYISGEAIATAPQDASITQIQNPDGGAGGTTDVASTNGTTGGAGSTVDGTVDGVTDTVDGVVDGVTDGVDDTVGDVTDVVDDVVDTGTGVVSDVTNGGVLNGEPLVNVDVRVHLDADLAAPIAGAVALNANVVAPIDVAAAANVGAVGSEAIAVSDQQAIITQTLDNVTAEATAEQTADIVQD